MYGFFFYLCFLFELKGGNYEKELEEKKEELEEWWIDLNWDYDVDVLDDVLDDKVCVICFVKMRKVMFVFCGYF